jgi:hypothetical protein
MSTQTVTTSVQPGTSSSSLVPALLAWCLLISVTMLAIFEMKAPAALPVTAPQNEFSADRALLHVRAIARTAHPIGSAANRDARDYVLAQLSLLGMNPEVTSAVGVNNHRGAVIAAKINNIVGRFHGTANSAAIILMAHYDSVANGPGAADDAAGVAAILEAARALRAGPPLKNDLIVLITDGEEAGLLGAEAFVTSHPWMKDAGLTMNFEARGNQGPSLLFETSANNAGLIKEFAHGAPHPVGSSLFYALYKLLPNDTDVTVFRPANTPALNFAFGSHLEAYHSSLDTPDNLSTASLQHHGSYAVGLVRRFGQIDLKQLKRHSNDDVFFNWLGSNLVTYSQRWVPVGESVVTLMLILTIVLSARRGTIRVCKFFAGLVASLAVLTVVPLAMATLGWLLLTTLRGRMITGDAQPNALLLTGLAALGLAIGVLVLARLRSWFNVHELSLSGLTVVCVLSWAIALLLPAGSYLLFWPVLLSTGGALTLALIHPQFTRGREWAASIPGCLIAILLFAPISYLLYIFLTLSLPTVAAVGLLLSSFFLICIPTLDIAAPRNQVQPVMFLLLTAAIACLTIGGVRSHTGGAHPRQDDLLYSLNVDDQSAVWASYDRSLDTWTSQFIDTATAKSQPLPGYLAGSQRLAIFGPAPRFNLAPPVAEIKGGDNFGGLHTIRMNVKSQRGAYRMVLRFQGTVPPVSLRISGRNVIPDQRSSNFSLILYGMGTEGTDLELTVKAHIGISFWLCDESAGLPVSPSRPAGLIAAQGSDETLVIRKYVLSGMSE